MKHIFSKIVFPAWLVIAALSTSCTKQVAGPKGEPGTPAAKGNMRKVSTNPITQASSSWTLNDNIFWQSFLYIPEIGDKVMKEGEVKVYMQIGTSWWCLPHSNGDIFTQYSIEEGLVRLRCSEIHGGPPAVPQTQNYRVVIMYPF